MLLFCGSFGGLHFLHFLNLYLINWEIEDKYAIQHFDTEQCVMPWPLFPVSSDLLIVLQRTFSGVLVPVPFFIPCSMLGFLCVLVGEIRLIVQINWASTVELFVQNSFNFLGFDFFKISKSIFYRLGLPRKLFKTSKVKYSEWLAHPLQQIKEFTVM